MKKTSFFTLILLGIFLLFFSACNKRKVCRENETEVWNSTHLEARLYDVPILIDAKSMHLLNSAEQGDNIIVAYASTMTMNDVLLFYQEHMERFGWRQIMCFKSDGEVLFNFEKPQKYCSISLRFSHLGVHIVIFNGQKMLAKN